MYPLASRKSRDTIAAAAKLAATAEPSFEPQLPSYTDLNCIRWCASDQESHLQQMLTECKSSFLGLRRSSYLGLAVIDLEDRPA